MVEGPDQTIQGTNKDDIVLLVDFKYITYGPDTIGYSPHGPNFPPTSWAGTHPPTLPPPAPPTGGHPCAYSRSTNPLLETLPIGPT